MMADITVLLFMCNSSGCNFSDLTLNSLSIAEIYQEPVDQGQP